MHSWTPAPVPRHPALVLVEDADPAARLAAHLELGRRAVARREFELAATHFREANDLDPTDLRARAELASLQSTPPERRRRLFSWW